MSRSIFYWAAGGGLLLGMSLISLVVNPYNFTAFANFLIGCILLFGAFLDMKKQKDRRTTKTSSVEWIAGIVVLVLILITAYQVAGKRQWDAYVAARPTPQEAMSIQVENIKAKAEMLYSFQRSMPDGDLTTILVNAGAFGPSTPVVDDYNSPLNVRDRAAMSRLKVDFEKMTVENEFGGEVKVLSKDRTIEVIYTNVPDGMCVSEAQCK